MSDSVERNHYYLYIDDHGSREPDHVPFAREDGIDCFALGGILVKESDLSHIVREHKKFCANWKITYPLHSTDIRGMRGKFRWLEDRTKDATRFHDELSTFLVSIPVIGFATVVSRPGYNVRYKNVYGDDRWSLCKTAYNILVERVAKYVDMQGATFEVFFESSGKKEDEIIKQYARILKKDGQPFDTETSSSYRPYPPKKFKEVMLGEPRERTKKCIFTQIADLYLYPMVKRKYDPMYRAWVELHNARRIVDSLLEDDFIDTLGIKYSCFDEVSLGSINPEASSG